MTAIEAAHSLHAKLCREPWYQATGIGSDSTGPVLYVYAKSLRHAKLPTVLSGLAPRWEGFPVVVRAIGTLRLCQGAIRS